MSANEAKLAEAAGNASVAVKDWSVCYNPGEEVIAVECTVVTIDDGPPSITGIGLVLNDGSGNELSASYTQLNNPTSGTMTSMNLPSKTSPVGKTVLSAVTGQAGG